MVELCLFFTLLINALMCFTKVEMSHQCTDSTLFAMKFCWLQPSVTLNVWKVVLSIKVNENV